MDIPAVHTIPYHICGCGYKTSVHGNASKHKKTKCGHEISVRKNDFVLKEDCENYLVEFMKSLQDNKDVYTSVKDDEIEKLTKLIASKTDENDKLNKIIQQQRKTLLKISETYKLDSDDEDDEDGIGIIYYITDKDLPSRGKIGRTKNTDLKKLKSRYSTFSKPGIMCFYSTNIKKDENDLKTMLKEHGCMDASIGKETVVNCTETRALFHDFASR
jgi:hypothetical protein